jgi:glycine cleavage system H protein
VSYPEDVRYTKDHEWARVENGLVTVGITSYATEQLGDIVYVELPDVGRTLESAKSFGVVEAVKTVSDLYAPIPGEVVEINGALAENPTLVNQEPFGEGWMIRIRPTSPDPLRGLLTSGDYEKLLEEQQA